MSTKINALTIIFKKDISENEYNRIVTAVCLFEGVLGVKSNVTDVNALMAQRRAENDISAKLWAVLRSEKNTQ